MHEVDTAITAGTVVEGGLLSGVVTPRLPDGMTVLEVHGQTQHRDGRIDARTRR